MTHVTDTVRNGVDTQKMFAGLDLIEAQPEVARFQIQATNRRIDGSDNRSTIKGLDAAGGDDTTPDEFHPRRGRAGSPAPHRHPPQPGALGGLRRGHRRPHRGRGGHRLEAARARDADR